jgi:uncharacterized protein YacL
MKQKKVQSLIEAATGTILGLVVSFVIQLILYPILDIDVSISQNITITIVFFVASICRSYIVRRVFNKLT